MTGEGRTLGARKQELGRWGEARAVEFLQDRGYEILETNYRCPLGEIDIIARDAGMLVFVEVRTRSSMAAGLPQESITLEKQRRLARVALHYLGRQPHETACRFDLLAIQVPRSGAGKDGERAGIHLFQDAFRP